MCSCASCRERSFRLSGITPGLTAIWLVPEHNIIVASQLSGVEPWTNPGFGDEEGFEQVHGIAVGHAGKKVASGRVQPLVFDRAGVEELFRALADFFPKPSQEPGCLFEFRGRGFILVDSRK